MRERSFTWKAVVICLLMSTLAPWAIGQETSIQNAFMRVQVSPAGAYQATIKKSGWQFGGHLGTVATQIVKSKGADRLGTFEEISFIYDQGGRRRGSMRIYGHTATVQFDLHFLTEGKNEGAFPTFDSQPEKLYHLGFEPLPHGLHHFGYLGSQGPWVLFDDRLNAVLMSPEDHYFITDMQSSAIGLSSAIVSTVTTLPAGFSHETVLVAGTGINQTIDAWGQTMQKMAGRMAPKNDADPLLRKLSYWTDHGGAYFYNFDPEKGYPGTLEAVKDKFAGLGLSLGSMQLDSWFYPKGEKADWHKTKWTDGVGGAYLYEPAKELFPEGLGAFSRELGLPLITHGRWIDQFSPYHKEYKMSGNVIIDPRYWQKTAAWLHAANVATYEQDWMGRYAKAEANLTDPEEFHDQMAQAMQHEGLTMQYCMAAPADFMQGTHYDNLTTIRTSHDRFDRKDWDDFLYDSRVANALGIWPWTDVFRSSEQANLIVSTLSAGPVGIGDSIDEVDAPDLLHALRGDGVIVKPDDTIRPLDRIYLQDARNIAAPMIANSWTSFGASRIAYVFAYARNKEEEEAKVEPAAFGFNGPVYVFDWRAKSGKKIDARETYGIPLQDGWDYQIISPVGASAMALIGDTEQIATAGRNRISQFTNGSRMHISMRVIPGEKQRMLTIYAPVEPHVTVISGKLEKQFYDSKNHLATYTLAAGSADEAVVEVVLPKAGHAPATTF
jgi:hypothetical protein